MCTLPQIAGQEHRDRILTEGLEVARNLFAVFPQSQVEMGHPPSFLDLLGAPLPRLKGHPLPAQPDIGQIVRRVDPPGREHDDNLGVGSEGTAYPTDTMGPLRQWRSRW
jgi:hypothetical protein